MVNLFNLWFILFIKVVRRAQVKKLQIDSDSIWIGAIVIFIWSISVFVLAISLPLLLFVFRLDKDSIKIIEFILFGLIYILTYLSYIRNDRWQKIERQIDEKLTIEKRDKLFVIFSIIYLFLYSLILAIFFGYVGTISK